MWYTMNSNFIPTINREQLLHFLGDFQKFKNNPALRAARVGQNLPSVGASYDATGVKTIV